MNGPELIREYILAMKGVDIVGVAEPRNDHEAELYIQALAVAVSWKMKQGTSND